MISDIMNTEQHRGRFRHVKGRETSLSYIVIQGLQAPNRGEGKIERIAASIDGRPSCEALPFVLKSIRQYTVKPVEPTDPMHPIQQLHKWQELKASGVSVAPTFRVSADNWSILTTDFTYGGTTEVFDLISFSLAQMTAKTALPPWIIDHRGTITTQVAHQASLAGQAGYSMSSDAYFVLYHTQTDRTQVVVGDLGRGISKPINHIRFGKTLAEDNIDAILNRYISAGICTHEERDEVVAAVTGWSPMLMR